jgi:hypothetical protein
MSRGDAIKSVTHVADVNCYPCSGLNSEESKSRRGEIEEAGEGVVEGERRKGDRGGGFGRGADSVGQGGGGGREVEPVDR